MARRTLENRFPEIAAEMRPRLSKAIKMGAEEIASTARMRVPVRSGALRDSITVKASGAAQFKVVAGDRDAFYAAMVEFGTSQSPAQPYLVPAAETGKAHVIMLAETVLRQLK